MTASPQAVTLGELLIDFVPEENGVSLGDARAFVKAPGGAPANVAVGLARLGIGAGFMGKVGDDPFGHHLAGVLSDQGVDVSQLKYDAQARTALAFVSLTSTGERDFLFYRNPSADMRHRPEEIAEDYLAGASMLHIGSISLIQDPSRSATLRALDLAAEHGLWVSYDANLRLPLWPSPDAAREGIRSVWRRAHVVKISEDELEFLTGARDMAAARTLRHDALRLLVVTRGDAGAWYLTRQGEGEVAGFRVDTVDTTGAGDAFTAALLASLLENDALEKSRGALDTAIRRANAYAALTTTRRGAIPALPSRQELEAFVAQQAG
ncbi:MAG: PfkB family carbohydrate kinase [Deinococcales bacterium]|jgi:fructokinase